MPDISTIFVCHNRLNLTELCLIKLDRTIGHHIDEFIVVYDGDDPEYIDVLERSTDIDILLSGESLGRYGRFDRVEDAYERVSGDHFLHMQNDFYIGEDIIDDALTVAEHHDLVRFEHRPFDDLMLEEIDSVTVGVRPKSGDFVYNDNPHIRTTVAPFADVRDDPVVQQRDALKKNESMYNAIWKSYDFTSACLLNREIRHLGVYSTLPSNTLNFPERFTLGQYYFDEELVVDIFEEFEDDPYLRDLFRQYVENHRKI